DYRDKEKRKANKEMEMIWMPKTSQGIENAIFTHITYHDYSSPPGFCFDVFCKEQINDNPNQNGYNVDLKANDFIQYFREMQNSYKSTELMHTAGNDFTYMQAQIPFTSYDKLFEFINQNPKSQARVLYSTPSQYIHSIYLLKLNYPEKHDDF